MNASNILQADLLDIIFDGRNKAYGAYELRRTYNSRLAKALIGAVAVLLLILLGNALANKMSIKNTRILMHVKDVELAGVKPNEKILPPVLPPPEADPQKVKTIKNTIPVIVVDHLAVEPPVEVDNLEDARIGEVNQDGIIDDGITAPPVSDGGRNIIEAPKQPEGKAESKFIPIEIESDYPGGTSAWQRYLNKNLRYSQEAVDNQIQGTVIVKFIVDKDGVVSDVEAISGPDELRDEAVRVIKKSGHWSPAIQNGRPVKTYKHQPITFRLETE